MIKHPKILPPPNERVPNLPVTAKWLSGEGAGSWFVLEATTIELQYKVTRLSPDGMIECEGIFISDKRINLEKDYTFYYPSHCLKVTIIQSDEKIELNVNKPD